MPRLSNPDNIATSPDGKEPSSPSVDNDEEVELLGVVVTPADALTLAVKSGTQDLLSTPAADATTHAFGKEETEVIMSSHSSTLKHRRSRGATPFVIASTSLQMGLMGLLLRARIALSLAYASGKPSMQHTQENTP